MIVGAILKSRTQYKEWLEIKGTVKADGIPKRKRIMVLDRYTTKMDIVYSNYKTGEYIWHADKKNYNDIQNRFLIIALDDTKTYNAMVYDYITPVTAKITVKLEA